MLLFDASGGDWPLSFGAVGAQKQHFYKAPQTEAALQEIVHFA
jgi:hypothetical protein